MASKAEVLAQVLEVLAAHNAKQKLVDEIEAILKPKTAGATVNVDEVTRKNENGEVTELLCSVSGVFLPATEDFFYVSKDGKGINGLKRVSKQGEAIRKAHVRNVAVSEKAIVQDILDSVISNEDGKAKIEDLRASKPDYSSVTATPGVPTAE